MKNKEQLPGINPQTFTLVFDKEFQKGDYIVGVDPYEKESESNSFAAVTITKPKKRIRNSKD
jgi:hypothetical protein